MKNGKAAGPSRFVSEMVQSRKEAIIDMTEPINQILPGLISAGWEFNIIVNCHKGKGYDLE